MTCLHRATVPALPISADWPLIAGLDLRAPRAMAAVKLAWDRVADVAYVVATYHRAAADPFMHATGVRAWGAAMPWAWAGDTDTAERLRKDGLALLPQPVADDPEEMAEAVARRLDSGRLKLFAHLAGSFPATGSMDSGPVTEATGLAVASLSQAVPPKRLPLRRPAMTVV